MWLEKSIEVEIKRVKEQLPPITKYRPILTASDNYLYGYVINS